jgi:kinesin family protein 5
VQESLGGNAKTTLLVCVADAKEHVDESLQSLMFGSRWGSQYAILWVLLHEVLFVSVACCADCRAMHVKNKPVVNERIDYRMLHTELLTQVGTQASKPAETNCCTDVAKLPDC